MAVAYVGRQDQMVNSWKAGALSIDVDVNTGVMGEGRTLPQFGMSRLNAHPDDQSTFTGRVLPKWDAVLEVCLLAAGAAPGCQIVCWEILISPDGPVILEGNLDFGIPMLQVHTEGFARHRFGELLAELGADWPDGSKRWIREHSQPSYAARAARFASRKAAAAALKVRQTGALRAGRGID